MIRPPPISTLFPSPPLSRPRSSSTPASGSGSWEAAAAAPAMVRKHPCPECGANLEWNAQAQALKCPYCGTTVPWSEETREELRSEEHTSELQSQSNLVCRLL